MKKTSAIGAYLGAIVAYLGAIVAGNLLAARLGAWVTPVVGFFLIGLDLTLRDLLHQGWQERGVLKRRMAALILAGSLLTILVNQAAWRIALASTLAFTVEATMATITYWLCFHWPRLLKMNAANLVGGLFDSLIFIPVAFGVILPMAMGAQWLTKFTGGALWAFLLTRKTNNQIK